jgi:hypothetical protein
MEKSYVEKHTIFETVVGSRAYGTNRPDSDFDKAGVMIPDVEYFFGTKKFEQFQGFPGEDKTIYDIRKGLRLIADNNPNMMDLLWVPDRCILKETPYWGAIKEKRDLFLSKKCRFTYSGYAFAQLSRIKTHRSFLLSPPKHKPSRQNYGLPETSVFPTSQLKAVCYAALDFIADEEKENFFKELDTIYADYVIPLFARFLLPNQRAEAMEWLQLGIKSQTEAFKSLGTQYIKNEYLEMAQKELSFHSASHQWQRYQQWKKARNPARAELEKKFGYDTKNAMHLVRLIRLGEEILETGQVNVDRTHIDAEELKAIRDGAWPYEKIEEYAQEKDQHFNELYQSTTLPKRADLEAIEKLCINIISKYFHDYRD